MVPLPCEVDRRQIVETILRKKPVAKDITAEFLVGRFDLRNYSGADINSFIENATREAAWGDSKSDLV